jgi:hypothetical protein
MRTRCMHLLCWVLVILLLPAFAARHALIVGCNNGGQGVEPLHWAESDADRFASILCRLGGFEPSAVVILKGPDSASLEGQLRKINSRSSKSAEEDLFLFYYSGHADGRDMLLGTTRFPLKRLKTAFDSLPFGMKVGIFDACQSGAVTAYKGGRRSEPFSLGDQTKIKGQVIIASTTASERAQESESLKGSIFSFYWFSGLAGSADISGDRRVTVDEAYRYAYRKTVETSTLTGGEAQHPMYRFAIHGQGDILLTDLTDKHGGVLFDRTCEGKFLVLSDSYTDIFADFFKKKNSEWFVALEPGNYRVINAQDREVGMTAIEIRRSNGSVRFSQSMLVPQELTESRIKGANPVARASLAVPSTRPLSTYTWGLGCGVLHRMNTSPVPAMLDVANIFYVNNRCNLFLDMIYLTRGLNGGGLVGFDVLSVPGKNRCFAGAGAGLFYFEKNSDDPVSPALTLHAGFLTDIGRQLQFAVEVPYCITYEYSTAVHRIGCEIRLLIPGKYRNVAALEYDTP